MATQPAEAGPQLHHPIGRRAAARARVQINAAIETTTGELPVIVRNLSQTGAMLEGSNLPKLDRAAVLRRGKMEAMGVVVWVEQGRCGFSFFDPIPAEEVVAVARGALEVPHMRAPSYGAAVADVITLDDWLRTKDRAAGRRQRPFKGFA